MKALSALWINIVIKNMIIGECNSRVSIGLAAMVYEPNAIPEK